MKNLKIYFTSDLHGYVYPTDYVDRSQKNIGLLNIINQFEKDGNTLIIDAGDTIQGSPFTNYLSTAEFDVHPIATIFNKAGYDYITLGNHDFNYGFDYLKKYLCNLDAKCLCANVDDKTNELGILPYDIKTLENGLKVGIIGFTTDFINIWERAENLANFTINDTISSIKPYYDELKGNVDVLIGVYHGGFEYDLESHKKLSETKENIAYKICTSFANVIKGFEKNVTVRDIMSTYPYPNTLVVYEVNRKYLELALERCASYFDFKDGEVTISDRFLKPKVEHYNYDYFANLNYTFDITKEIGNRVTSIVYNGKELDHDTTLKLVMNNYRASGAGGYEFYTECKVVKEILMEMPDIIIDYFKNNTNVTVDKSKYLTVLA